MKEAEIYLNKLLNKNDTLVVGVSGGPDSMCLLSMLLKLKNKYNLKIICAHVNHKLRKESENEKKFVENYAVINNIIFEYTELSYENGFSESIAREKRYKFFDELIKKYNAKYLMTAHHGDDLIGTILMRIVRGSNLKGYIGIPKISDNGFYKVVRPLLYLDKEEILDYLKNNNIKYVIDKSNKCEKYTRNRYRKHLLPFLKKEEKNVHLKFLKYSEVLEKNNNYIKHILDNKIKDIVNNNIIDIKKLKKEDTFIQEKIIEHVIENIQKDYIFNINDEQFRNIIKLINTNRNKEIDLKDNFIARCSYGKLYIEKKKKTEEYEYILDNDLKILNKYNFKFVKNSDCKSNNIIRLNSKEIKLPLIVRTKKDGDKIKVKNLNGTKKVKDILIDSKIDKKERYEYPLVCDSKNDIIWIPGIKKSIYDKEISEKYDIIIKYERKNI